MKKIITSTNKLKLKKIIIGTLTPKELVEINGGGPTVKTTRGSLDANCTTRTGGYPLFDDNVPNEIISV